MTYKPPYTIPEVLRLKTEGQTHSQIADHFGISSSRVGQIIKREGQQAVSAERSAAIRNEIRASNDIGKALSLDDLFCVLNLPSRPRSILMAHFNRQGIRTFSLQDMMDFLIPFAGDAKDHYDLYDYLPAYRVKMLGQILYATMIKGLSAIDCGEVFRAEWTARKKSLREYLIGTGGFYPYILNGKNAALR